MWKAAWKVNEYKMFFLAVAGFEIIIAMDGRLRNIVYK